jgi:hypothetical protein
MDTPAVQAEQFDTLSKMMPAMTSLPPQAVKLLITASSLRDKDKLLEIVEQMEQNGAQGPEMEAQAAQAKAQAEGAVKVQIAEIQAQTDIEVAKIKAMTARVVRAEVKALAGQTFADPDDAAAFLDLASYVDEAGEVDAAAITKDLAALLKRKPHLAAGSMGRIDLGQGNRGDGPSRPSQLTKADLKSMTPDAIEKARTEGRFNDLLGIK